MPQNLDVRKPEVLGFCGHFFIFPLVEEQIP